MNHYFKRDSINFLILFWAIDPSLFKKCWYNLRYSEWFDNKNHLGLASWARVWISFISCPFSPSSALLLRGKTLKGHHSDEVWYLPYAFWGIHKYHIPNFKLEHCKMLNFAKPYFEINQWEGIFWRVKLKTQIRHVLPLILCLP